MNYIKFFDQIGIEDVGLVGGKNASLGQMINGLRDKGIPVPQGFAVTASGYWRFLDANSLREPIQKLLQQITITDYASLDKHAAKIRELMSSATMPEDLKAEIEQAYALLSQRYNQTDLDVAVRSSATAEDLPTASFAGQQETYIHIQGVQQLLEAVKKCFASLFTNRAIVYRVEHTFEHMKIALSVGIQKMVRSDLACAGVAFSLDTESGFKDVVMINGSYGLGESLVKGLVTPDEFLVHKPTLAQGFSPIIKKTCGTKEEKMIYDDHKLITVSVEDALRHRFCLMDHEILQLARMVAVIEQYYSSLRNTLVPMDVEWAKDGQDGIIYIVQARPETVHAVQRSSTLERYTLKVDHEPTMLVSGQSIGQAITSGTVRVIQHVDQISAVQKGDILVTDMTDPDWVPAMKKAAGIVTNRGGRTCHAAIVSRELMIPALVGAAGATTNLTTGQRVTIDCSQGQQGYVYEGEVPFEKMRIAVEQLPELPCKLLVNIAQPDQAFNVSTLPVDGVGLARIEFIISANINMHPLAIVHPERVDDRAIRRSIEQAAEGYPDLTSFFIDTLAQGIGMIAAAFYPKPVVVRLSDFKTNEYRNLLGGSYFEAEESNPMLGFRGASRYIDPEYQPAFALECQAFKKTRNEFGLKNIIILVPFVRTVQEAKQVIKLLAQEGLERSSDLSIMMMCEVPSNVILIDDFSDYFDGFSIGSNDLAQLTLGVDRDSPLLAARFDERDAAVMTMMRWAIEGAHRNNRTIGICGQAPSDYPEIADALISDGIDSISLNQDSVLPFLMRYAGKS